MKQPEHDLRPFQASIVSPRRFVSLGMVGALHIVMIYALATGLAQRLVNKLPDEFKAEVVQQKPPEQEKAPPPPPPDLVKPPPPFVPPPDISIQEAGPATNAITSVQSHQQVAAVSHVIPPQAIGRSHDCQSRYYPPISARLNESGATTVKYTVNADGSVGAASVENSSGYSRLDDAAIQCVQNQFRQKPAMENGKPIAVTAHVRVVWRLQ